MADEVKTKTLRATDEQMAKLKEISESGNFKNQGEALAMLIEVYERTTAKDIIPERATEIEDFNVLLKKLADKFLYSLELNMNAEERARANVSGQLSVYEDTISKQKAEIGKLNESNKELTARTSALEKELEGMSRSHELESRSWKEERARLSESTEEKVRLLDALQREVDSSKEKIRRLEAQLADLPNLQQKIESLQAALLGAKQETEKCRLAAEKSKGEADARANEKIAEANERAAKIQESFTESIRKIQSDAEERIRADRDHWKHLLNEANEALKKQLSMEDMEKAIEKYSKELSMKN